MTATTPSHQPLLATALEKTNAGARSRHHLRMLITDYLQLECSVDSGASCLFWPVMVYSEHLGLWDSYLLNSAFPS